MENFLAVPQKAKHRIIMKESESHSVLSDSLQPHGLEPARVLCPWDSPGKNTVLEWEAVPFFRGSSRPRDWTQFSRIAGDSLLSEPELLKELAILGFPGGASVKEPTWQYRRREGWSLGWEDPLEEGMASHSSILVWRIPWTEEPGGLQSMGSQGVGHDWSDLALEIPLLAIHLKEWKPVSTQKLAHVVYSSIIHNSQKVKATQLSISSRIYDEQINKRGSIQTTEYS